MAFPNPSQNICAFIIFFPALPVCHPVSSLTHLIMETPSSHVCFFPVTTPHIDFLSPGILFYSRLDLNSSVKDIIFFLALSRGLFLVSYSGPDDCESTPYSLFFVPKGPLLCCGPGVVLRGGVLSGPVWLIGPASGYSPHYQQMLPFTFLQK